jgi:hypothetical protein
MNWSADELIAPGGPSAPVWIFLTTIVSGVFLTIQQLIKAKHEAREARSEASKAAESAAEAASNTQSVSNGFAGRVDRKLDRIIASQSETDKALREHLRWHLDRSE